MTKEELKQKCTERAKIFQQAMESCHSSSPIDCIEWFADRIAELTEWLNDASDEKLKLQMLRVDLVSKIGNQEKQIAELKALNNELLEEGRLHKEQITELQGKKAQYKEMCEDMKADMCGTDNEVLFDYLVRILKKYGEIV